MKQDGLSASLEDYLEAIYLIIQNKQGVRVKDISKRLGVSNASVTGALKALAQKGLIHYAPYDIITLTSQGEELAKDVAWRHQTLKEFFVKVLLIDPETADQAACKMEHGVPTEIIDRFIHFIQFIEVCPLGGEKLKEDFKQHLQCSSGKEKCDICCKKGGTG